MGRAFGNLTRVRHVITYSLSPFEQRAFPHYFTKGIPNVLRRIQASILRSAPRECPGRVGAGLPSPALTAGPLIELLLSGRRSASCHTHVFSLKIPEGPRTSHVILQMRKLSHRELNDWPKANWVTPATPLRSFLPTSFLGMNLPSVKGAVAQHCEFAKNHRSVHFKKVVDWWILLC